MITFTNSLQASAQVLCMANVVAESGQCFLVHLNNKIKDVHLALE